MADKPWDDEDWQQNDELTSAEWNSHVSDGHFPADEVNFGVNGDGDPVVTDPQNADEVIARYDRSAGSWVFQSVGVERATLTKAPLRQVPQDYPSRADFTTQGDLYESASEINANWTATNGSMSLESSITYLGAETVRLEDTGGGKATIQRDLSAAEDFSQTSFSIAVYPVTPISSLRLKLLDANNDIVQLRDYTMRADGGNFSGGWMRADFPFDQEYGSPDRTAIERIDIESRESGAEFLLADFRTVGRRSKAHVMFQFDDGNATDYDIAYPELGKRGWAGACFVPAQDPGSGSTPTVEQYQEMQRDGWDIGVHSIDDQRLPDLTTEEKRERIIDARQWHLENGFHRGARFFKPPGYAYDKESLDMIADHYAMHFVGAGSVDAYRLPITDPLTVGVTGGDDHSTAETKVDTAVSENELCILGMHDITDEAGFTSLLDHVKSYEDSGDLEVITPSQMLIDLRSNVYALG